MAKPRAQRTPSQHRARNDPDARGASPADAGTPERGPIDAPSTAEIARGFGQRTSVVVQQAASILEEELAAGIVAARQMADKFMGTRSAQSSNPEDLLPRFRKDAHEVVDMLIDVLTAGTRSVGKIAQRVVRFRVGPIAGKKSPAAAESVPVLSTPAPVTAGEAARLEMSVENDGAEPTEQFEFHSSDLVSETGHRIAASRVTFHPESVILEPGQRAKVTIAVNVPDSSPAGAYTAVLQATKMGQLRAMLVVRVSGDK